MNSETVYKVIHFSTVLSKKKKPTEKYRTTQKITHNEIFLKEKKNGAEYHYRVFVLKLTSLKLHQCNTLHNFVVMPSKLVLLWANNLQVIYKIGKH
jgi:hypothetical protein